MSGKIVFSDAQRKAMRIKVQSTYYPSNYEGWKTKPNPEAFNNWMMHVHNSLNKSFRG
jgi:hypothetical protein